MAKPKRDDKAQSKRFIDKASELEAGNSNEAFERAIKKIVPPKSPSDPGRDDAKSQNAHNAERER